MDNSESSLKLTLHRFDKRWEKEVMASRPLVRWVDSAIHWIIQLFLLVFICWITHGGTVKSGQ